MKDSQHALHEMVANFLTSDAQADLAVGVLTFAAVMFGIGWLSRQQMSPWRAASLGLSGLALGVAILAVQVPFDGWLADVDRVVTAWFVEHRSPLVDQLALGVTNGLGPIATGGLALAASAVVGIRCRSRLCGLTIFATVGGASALSWLLKLLVARPRPPIAIQETLETDYSFPSGHVTGSAALFGIVAVAAGLTGRRVVAKLSAAVAVLTVTAVALSRLYLGVHWLTDVIAGALVGAAAVTVGAAVLRTLVERERPPRVVAELQASPTSMAARVSP